MPGCNNNNNNEQHVRRNRHTGSKALTTKPTTHSQQHLNFVMWLSQEHQNQQIDIYLLSVIFL